MATSTVTDWDEIEADPDFSSLPQESRVKLFDDWENKFNRSLLEGADLDKVKPEGLNSFAAVNAVRRRKLAGEDVSDPDAAAKTWAEQKQAEAKLGQQALKDYADVEDKAFRLDDARSMPGVDEFGRSSPEWDKNVESASKNLEAAEAKFTPEVKAQAQAANEALRGERKVATLYGGIYTDPALVLNKDEFRQQVLDSDASPEAKALKLASYQSEKKRYLDEAVNTLTKGDPQIPLAESFPKFLESKGFDLNQEMMQQSEGKLDYSPIQKQRELAQEYLTKMQDRGWSRKIGSAIATGVATGMLDIGTQAVGTAAMLTGDEEKSKVAAELSRASGDIGAAQGLEGDMQATGGTFAGGVARLGTGMAPMFLPGGAVGGIARLAGAGAGAATAAAVGASALTAGAQTAGSQFGEVYDHLRRQGRTHEQAFDVSRNAAVLSGAVTTGLTALGGATGVESLLRQGGKELVKSRLLSAIKAVPGGAAAEIAEELPDEYISQLVSAFAKDPNASPSQVTDEFAANAPDLMLQIAALGGAGAGVGRFRETTTDPTKAAQEAEFPTAGAPPPLRPQDYENRAAGGQPMFNEDGDVIGVAPPGATPEETAAYREEIRAAAEAATKGATPEVVDPIEGVDPAITDEMNERVTAGAGLAPQTVEALKAAQAATSAPAAETLGVTPPPAPAVQAETEATEAPVVEPTEEAETLGVTPPPAPAMEVPEGAARNADMLRQAAARAAGTEQGPRIGFLRPSEVAPATEAPPITPQGTPTPATEGTVMPGGSAAPPSRGRPVERVVFEKPIKTPIGEIVSYDWQYKVEEVPDKEGEMGLRRFSDWDQAEKNADTGRDIVHQFTVRKPDGTTQLVSLESALGKIPVTAAKGFKAAIKAARRLPVYEAELARLELQQKNRIEAENKARKEGWKNSPPIELRDSGFPAAMAAGARMAWIGDNEVALVDKRDISEDGTRINSAIKSQEIKTEWAMGQIKTPSLSYGEQTRIDNLRRSIKRDKETLKENEITQTQSSSESAQGPQVVRGVSPSNLGENDTAQESPQTTTVAAPTETAAPAEWAPAVSTPAAFTAKNGQKLVGTVQSIKNGKAVVRFLWNGKEVVETVPVSQLARPVASLTEPPKYQYTQEQNTRKMGKHFPTAPGVYTNYDFRKSFASMAKDTSLSRIYRMIAKVMSKMPAFANMDLHVVADEDVRYAGEYSFSNGKGAIAVNLRQVGRGKVDALGTILHEALHHLTLAKVRNPKDAWENEIIDKLDAIRGRVLEYAESQGLGERLGYELNTVEEFISAVFTRPDFQNFLASIPDSFAPAVAVGKFRSMLSEVFRRLAELVTGEMVAKGSTMEQAMTSVLALFETPHRGVETGKLEALNAGKTRSAPGTPKSYAGESAEIPQFMRDSLDTAKAMAAAGKTSEEIRAVTGWFPGKYDGKMRWEVPDNEAKLRRLPAIGKKLTLEEVIDHPALFEAYPNLRNREVWGANLPTENVASFNPQGYFNVDPRSELFMFGQGIDTMLHEVQHAIQKMEGFAEGGSPSQFETEANSVKQRDAMRKAVADARSLLRTAAFQFNGDIDAAARFFAGPPYKQKVAQSAIKLAKRSTKKDLDEIDAELLKSYIEGKKDEPTAKYKRLAGEIEARDVAARHKFTPEQRAAIEPYSSENIAKEDAIVAFDGGKIQDKIELTLPAVPEEEGGRLPPSTWDSLEKAGYIPEAAEKTQITTTGGTYVRILDKWASKGMEVLDYAAGRGFGTEEAKKMGKENGFSVVGYEPFSNPKTRAIAPEYEGLGASKDIPNNSKDVVIVNAVINVVPDSTAREIIEDAYSKVKVGGSMFINVMGWNNIKGRLNNPKTKLVGPREVITERGTFQKGYKPDTLRALIEGLVPDATLERTDYGDIGFRVIKNKPTVAVNADNRIAYSMADDGERQLEGANMGRAMEMLGASLYAKNVSGTIGKEVFQNAVDAVMKNENGQTRTIWYGYPDNTRFVVADTGTGMNPDIIVDKFLRAFVSDKDVGAGGGFGLAKLAFLGSPRKFKIISVGTSTDGRKVKTTLQGTGKSFLYFNEHPPRIRFQPDTDITLAPGFTMRFSYEDAQALPTGTAMEFDMDEPWNASSAITNGMGYVEGIQSSAIRKGTTDLGYGNKATGDELLREMGYSSARSDESMAATLSSSKPYTVLHSFSTTNADVDVIVREGAKIKKTRYTYVPVLNRSIFQFSTSFNLSNEVALPEGLVVNIKPKVLAGTADYPFTTNRESVTDSVKKEIERFFQEAGARENAKLNAKYANAVDSAAQIPGTGKVLLDTASTLPPALLDELTNSASVQRALGDVAKIQDAILSMLGRKFGPKFQRAKFAGLITGARAYGVHFGKPGSLEPTAIYHDIWKEMAMAEEEFNTLHDNDPAVKELSVDDQMRLMYDTFLTKVAGVAFHEALHQDVNSEGEPLARELTFKAGDIVDAVVSLLNNTHTQDEINTTINDLSNQKRRIDTYEDSQTASEFVTAQGGYDGYAMAERGPATGSGKGSGKTGSQRVGATPFSPADDADQRESDVVFGVMMEDGRFEEGLKQYDKAKRARLGAPPQPSANTSTPPRFANSAQFAAAFEAAYLRGDFDYFLEALKQADRQIYVPEMKKYINASKLGYADAAERLEWFRHAIAGTVPPNVKPQAKTPPQPQPSAGAPPPPVGMPPPPPAATPPPKAGVSNRPMLTLNTAAMGLIAKKLGASIRINTLLRRARGRIKLSMADGSEIELSKHLFKDPVQAAKTLAHEIGHLFDFLPASGFTRTLAYKLAPLGDFRKVFGNDLADWFMDGGKKIKPSKITQLIKSELVTLSKKWRGDFSPSDKYRGSGKELYADFISAILNDPLWTAKNAPYATLGFLNALEQKPEVDEAYKLVVSLVQGGSLYKALAEADRGKSTTALERLIAKSDALTKSKKIFKDAVRGLYRSMFGSWLPTAVRDGGIWNSYWKRLNNLGTPKDYNWAQEEASQYTVRRIAEFDNDIARDVGIPLKTAGIDPHYLQRLQTNNRIIHERRQVGKLIEEDPVKARQLLKWMVDAGLLGKDVQDEVDATADEDLYKKTAEVIYKLHASGDSFERALKAARRKDAPADAEKALYAFDVSGFMLNPNVFTMESAEADNADIEKTLGPDQFGELQRINDAYHDLIKRIMVDAYKLGLFRKSTWDDVIVPNFGVYVPFMPIKYFTGYVKGGIGPSRVGTANDLMAPHVVGISKMHALISRMQQQKQALLLIDLFNNTGLSNEIEPVEDEKFDRQKAAELTKQSKNTISYMPYWDEGEYKWVKVNGTDAVSFIRNSDPDDLAAVYQLLSANTRLWRMNFTIFSIAFNVVNTLRNVVTPFVDIGPKAGYKSAKQLLSVFPQIGKWVWARMAGRDMTSLVAASISVEHAMHKPGMPVSAELQEFYDRGILQPSPDVASLRMTQEELARSVVGALSSPQLLLRGGNKAAKDMNWFDKTLKQYFYSAVDVLSFIGSVSEAAPKVAAYKALKEKKVPEKITVTRVNGNVTVTGLNPDGTTKMVPAFTDAQATYLATLEGIPRPGVGGSDNALWEMVLLFFRIMGQSWRKHLIMSTAPQTRAGFLMRHMLFQGAKFGLQAMAANGVIDYLIALGAAAAAGGDDDDIEKYKQVDWAEAVSRQSDYKLSHGGVGPLICWVLPDGSIEPPYGHKSIPADWVPIMPRLPGTEFSRELDPMSYYATSKTIAPTIAPVNDDVFWNDYMRGLVSLNPTFDVVSDAMSVLGPTPPRDSYRGREKVEQRIWDEGYVARMLGLGEHHLRSFGIGSNPYDVPLPGALNVLKKPGFKSLISTDNMVGVREERRARREDDLTSSFAQNMVGEKFGTLKNTFNRLKGKATPRTDQEEEIYNILKPVMSKQFYGTQKNDGMYDVLQSYARMKAQGLQDTPGGQLLKAEADQVVKDLEQIADDLQKPLEYLRTHTLP